MVKKKTKTTLDCTCEIPTCGKSWESQGEQVPKVCRWCYSRRWNGQDLRSKLVLTAQGKTQKLYEWAKETGLSSQCIRYRLKVGWTHEQALGFATHERKRSA